MIRVLIADDHTIVRQGLTQLLFDIPDIEVVGGAGNGAEVLSQLRGKVCDVVLLDLTMPGLHGVELIRQIKAEHPKVLVLVLSMHKEEQFALRALKAGASGYLTKESAVDELVTALHAIVAGEIYISAGVARAMALDLVKPQAGPAPGDLSEREFSVLVMIGRGIALNAIAEQMHLSPKTVSTYKARLLQKLGLANTAELVRYAIDHRLLEDRRGSSEPE